MALMHLADKEGGSSMGGLIDPVGLMLCTESVRAYKLEIQVVNAICRHQSLFLG